MDVVACCWRPGRPDDRAYRQPRAATAFTRVDALGHERPTRCSTTRYAGKSAATPTASARTFRPRCPGRTFARPGHEIHRRSSSHDQQGRKRLGRQSIGSRTASIPPWEGSRRTRFGTPTPKVTSPDATSLNTPRYFGPCPPPNTGPALLRFPRPIATGLGARPRCLPGHTKQEVLARLDGGHARAQPAPCLRYGSLTLRFRGNVQPSGRAPAEDSRTAKRKRAGPMV
jgi:hypothetical protein